MLTFKRLKPNIFDMYLNDFFWKGLINKACHVVFDQLSVGEIWILKDNISVESIRWLLVQDCFNDNKSIFLDI